MKKTLRNITAGLGLVTLLGCASVPANKKPAVDKYAATWKEQHVGMYVGDIPGYHCEISETIFTPAIGLLSRTMVDFSSETPPAFIRTQEDIYTRNNAETGKNEEYHKKAVGIFDMQTGKLTCVTTTFPFAELGLPDEIPPCTEQQNTDIDGLLKTAFGYAKNATLAKYYK